MSGRRRSRKQFLAPMEDINENGNLINLPCLQNDLNLIGYMVLPSGFSPFSASGSIVVPWHWITTREEQIFLSFHLCAHVLVSYNRHPCYTHSGVYSLHCHCREKTLRCLTAGKVQYELCKNLFKGSCYNNYFPFYRVMANKDVAEEFHYVGSITFRGNHYIFLSDTTGGRVLRSLKKFHQDRSKYWFCEPRWLVLCCHSCGRQPNELKAKCCAKYVNRFLKRCRNLASVVACPSKYEHERQRKFRRMLTRGKCQSVDCGDVFPTD